ncbi:facilitated trehalose transporter Tret1-like [Pararge aegeria]|uniref:Jg13871 protein n=1 Tax=Pararge aegeria aegeria TaxID=348720 RepID=A0A8S4S4K6_9NEOP|nr:facilitated trehalose transporter Tret1-like [Pararge aegeria]CAH2252069.1 jg13871 [Pararge aegeria aegeria]
MDTEKVKFSAYIVQGLAAFIIAYLSLLTGFVYAWPSFTMEMFKSNSTVLSTSMSATEASLLGSLTNIGGLMVSPFCGYVVDKIGRKYSAMMFGVPFVVSWGLIYFTKSVSVVLLSIWLAGFGAGGQGISSMYISEISQDSIRGALTSSFVSVFLLGLLVSYIIGGYLSYEHVVFINFILSMMFILLLTLIKESPVYLLKRGRNKEAAESLAFYRRVEANSVEVQMEIKKITLQLNPKIDKILQDGDDVLLTTETGQYTDFIDQEKKSEAPWRILRQSKSSKRALTSVLIVMSLTILMGSVVMQIYAESLFKEAIPTMHPNTCSILLAVDYFLASFVCACMVDKFGRKTLMTVTSIISGVFTILLGSQLQKRWAPHWFTAFVIYGYSFVYNLGVAVVPFVLMAEVYLPEVRGLCNMLSMACMWIMNFVIIFIYNPLVILFGLGPAFYIFSTVCFIGAAYSHFCLPETKGLPADKIQLLFLKKKYFI